MKGKSFLIIYCVANNKQTSRHFIKLYTGLGLRSSEFLDVRVIKIIKSDYYKSYASYDKYDLLEFMANME